MEIDVELLVGWATLLFVGFLGYLSLQFGQVSFAGNQGYSLSAEFSDAGGLQSGARVELAGVEIGRVSSVSLSPNLIKARVTFELQSDIALPQDSRATIKTAGLIGERYINLEPGTATQSLAPGGQIHETESPVDVLDTIGQALFGNFSDSAQCETATSSSNDANPWEIGLD